MLAQLHGTCRGSVVSLAIMGLTGNADRKDDDTTNCWPGKRSRFTIQSTVSTWIVYRFHTLVKLRNSYVKCPNGQILVKTYCLVVLVGPAFQMHLCSHSLGPGAWLWILLRDLGQIIAAQKQLSAGCDYGAVGGLRKDSQWRKEPG